jgi:hydroxymethylglutaryl-CoA lyase
VTLTEVAPRDGLQSFPFALSVDQRAALIRELAATGLRSIEVTSFVHPRLVPQHAGAEELCAALLDLARDGVTLSAYVPNARGLTRALTCDAITKVGFAVGATDELTQHNTRTTTQAAIDEIAPLLAEARAKGVTSMGAVSAVLGCPFTGPVAVSQVLGVVDRLVAAGFETIQLADTIGTGTPAQVTALGEAIRTAHPSVHVSWHFHDTFGMGLANAVAAARLGFTDFDASTGGTGGCPFAPGAAGNVATEELLYALGSDGVDLVALAAIARRLRDWAGTRALSKIALVGELSWRDEFLDAA